MINQCECCLRVLSSYQALVSHKQRLTKCSYASSEERNKTTTITVKGISEADIKKILRQYLVDVPEPEPEPVPEQKAPEPEPVPEQKAPEPVPEQKAPEPVPETKAPEPEPEPVPEPEPKKQGRKGEKQRKRDEADKEAYNRQEEKKKRRQKERKDEERRRRKEAEADDDDEEKKRKKQWRKEERSRKRDEKWKPKPFISAGEKAYNYMYSLDGTIAAFDTLTQAIIKKIYRKLALIHHPDKGGDETTFKTLLAAYETLMYCF